MILLNLFKTDDGDDDVDDAFEVKGRINFLIISISQEFCYVLTLS